MSYLKLPKQLFKDPKYKNLSANAKLLYALLLDRHSLSEKNNKTDEKGKTVVYFTREEARSILGIGKDSIIKCFADLKQAELLEEGFLGVGKTHPLTDLVHGKLRILQQLHRMVQAFAGNVFQEGHAEFFFKHPAEIGRVIEAFLCQVRQGELRVEIVVNVRRQFPPNIPILHFSKSQLRPAEHFDDQGIQIISQYRLPGSLLPVQFPLHGRKDLLNLPALLP